MIQFKGDYYALPAFLNICGVYLLAAVGTAIVIIVVGITACALAVSDAMSADTDLRLR